MADDSQERVHDEAAPQSAVAADRPTAAVGKPPTRLAFIDGLRGLAALGIAVYHIWRYEPPPYPAMEFVPGIVDWVLLKSWVGVQFLLVISGFVIAFTLRDTWVTPREVVSFLARRVVRLGPPYWFTLVFVLALHAANVAWWHLPASFEKALTTERVIAHFAFLQDVLGHKPLSAAIWTVCIEMQFYVVYVIGFGLVQRLMPRPDPQQARPSGPGLLVIFAPLALIALLYWNRLESTEPWVIHFLNSFFLGMVTWWALDRTISPLAFRTTLAVATAHLVLQWSAPELPWLAREMQDDGSMAVPLALEWRVENLLVLIAALSIYVAGRTGHFHDWLNWRWLQYLGKISYSLYLIHYPVSHFLTWLGWRWCQNAPTPAQSSLILLTCLVASIAAGHLLYVGLEAPAGRWAARLKARRPVA